MAKQNWLQPSELTDEERAMLKRIARENHMSVEDVIAALDELQASPPPTKPKPSLLKTRGRHAEPPSPGAYKPEPLWQSSKSPAAHTTEPRPVVERPDPSGTELGYDVQHTRPLDPTPELATRPEQQEAAPKPQPDPRLIEIARLWSLLSDRDREELRLIAKMKAHLNTKPTE